VGGGETCLSIKEVKNPQTALRMGTSDFGKTNIARR